MSSRLPAYCALPYKHKKLRLLEVVAPVELCYLQAKRSWCQGQHFCGHERLRINATFSPTNSCDADTQLSNCAVTEISSLWNLFGSAVHRLLYSQRFRHPNSAALFAVIAVCVLILLLVNWV